MTDTRVTRQSVEVIHITVEVPDARVTRQGVEVIHGTVEVPNAHVTRQGIEVITQWPDPTPVSTDRRTIMTVSFLTV